MWVYNATYLDKQKDNCIPSNRYLGEDQMLRMSGRIFNRQDLLSLSVSVRNLCNVFQQGLKSLVFRLTFERANIAYTQDAIVLCLSVSICHHYMCSCHVSCV